MSFSSMTTADDEVVVCSLDCPEAVPSDSERAVNPYIHCLSSTSLAVVHGKASISGEKAVELSRAFRRGDGNR